MAKQEKDEGGFWSIIIGAIVIGVLMFAAHQWWLDNQSYIFWQVDRAASSAAAIALEVAKTGLLLVAFVFIAYVAAKTLQKWWRTSGRSWRLYRASGAVPRSHEELMRDLQLAYYSACLDKGVEPFPDEGLLRLFYTAYKTEVQKAEVPPPPPFSFSHDAWVRHAQYQVQLQERQGNHAPNFAKEIGTALAIVTPHLSTREGPITALLSDLLSERERTELLRTFQDDTAVRRRIEENLEFQEPYADFPDRFKGTLLYSLLRKQVAHDIA